MSDVRLWVLCPCYNDVPAFTILRNRVLEIIDQTTSMQRTMVRFVVVDDTAGRNRDVAQLKATDDTTVITPPFNLGHQRAIVYGLRMILPDLDDSDLIVTMDADGEDRPEDVPRLLEPLLEADDDYQAVCVARRTKRSESFGFKVMYTVFRTMFRGLTGTTVRSGNFAAYRGFLARRILQHPYFDLCYSSTLVSLDLDINPVPCERGTRYAGHSRMNLLRLIMHGVRMLMPFTDRIAVRALIAFSSIFGLGLLLALAVVAIRVFTDAAIPGWTTFTLLGILLLSFVALGNFVVLFAVFSHSRGLSLANLEEWNGRRAGSTSASAD